MVIWNELEDLRRRENAQRGYVEVKTPLIYDVESGTSPRGTGRSSASTCSSSAARRRAHVRAEADELPRAHAPLRRSQLRSYRELPLPLRRVVARSTATSSPGRSTACCACGTSPRTTRTSSAPASRSRTRSSAVSTTPSTSTSSSTSELPLRALDPAREQARHRRGVGLHRRRAEGRARPAGASNTSVNEGDGAFYGPKIDLHMTDALGRSWQMGTIQLDCADAAAASASPTWAPTTASTRPTSIHRALLGSLERFIGILIEHYAGAFPFWLAPVQVRVIPVGEDHREAADALAGKIPYRVEVDDSDETVGKRIRNAELEKIPYVVVYGDKESDDVAGHPRARRGAVDEVACGLPRPNLVRFDPASRSGTVSSPPEPRAPWGFNRVERRGAEAVACLRRSCRFPEGGTRSLVTAL